ncbi:MAG: glycosyltransferase [Gemmatimonadales bacterium]|nr:glycosyltransferase [Gemmatimonadales bacterium]
MIPADLAPALPWLAPFIVLARLASRSPSLSDAPATQAGLVSIIVPARNEADNIEAMVRSVLATTYEPVEILIVDDCSTDRTRDIVRSLAQEDGRVRLIEGAPLAPGWFGKPWACVQGYRLAAGDYLVFTDADTRHEPPLLAHAIGAARQHQADLVTISPRQLCLTFWERVIMPQVLVILGSRFTPKVVNNPRSGRDVIANGQFILVTRESYEAVGTHEVVRGEVAEDLGLAQRYFGASRKMHFAFAESLMATRMYRSLAGLIEGWSKNMFLGARQSYPSEPLRRALMPLLLAFAFVFWLVPPAFLLVAALGVQHTLFDAAVAATIASIIFWGTVSFGMAIPPIYALAYPLGAMMTLFIYGRSLWRGKRVEWRGREYGVGSRKS